MADTKIQVNDNDISFVLSEDYIAAEKLLTLPPKEWWGNDETWNIAEHFYRKIFYSIKKNAPYKSIDHLESYLIVAHDKFIQGISEDYFCGEYIAKVLKNQENLIDFREIAIAISEGYLEILSETPKFHSKYY